MPNAIVATTLGAVIAESGASWLLRVLFISSVGIGMIVIRQKMFSKFTTINLGGSDNGNAESRMWNMSKNMGRAAAGGTAAVVGAKRAGVDTSTLKNKAKLAGAVTAGATGAVASRNALVGAGAGYAMGEQVGIYTDPASKMSRDREQKLQEQAMLDELAQNYLFAKSTGSEEDTEKSKKILLKRAGEIYKRRKLLTQVEAGPNSEEVNNLLIEHFGLDGLRGRYSPDGVVAVAGGATGGEGSSPTSTTTPPASTGGAVLDPRDSTGGAQNNSTTTPPRASRPKPGSEQDFLGGLPAAYGQPNQTTAPPGAGGQGFSDPPESTRARKPVPVSERDLLGLPPMQKSSEPAPVSPVAEPVLPFSQPRPEQQPEAGDGWIDEGWTFDPTPAAQPPAPAPTPEKEPVAVSVERPTSPKKPQPTASMDDFLGGAFKDLPGANPPKGTKATRPTSSQPKQAPPPSGTT